MLVNGDVLFARLGQAKRSDLEALAQDLRMADPGISTLSDAELADRVSRELRSAAGNSLVNALCRRGPHDFPYRTILIDVADKLTPGMLTRSRFKGSEVDIVEIEDYIADLIDMRVADNLAKMSDADKRKMQERLLKELRAQGVPEGVIQSSLTGMAAGTLSGVALGHVVAVLLYGGIWTTLFGVSLVQLLLGGLAVGGPVGIAAATVLVLSSTSYSKTIPVVYRLIQIRKAAEVRAELENA